MAWCEIEDRPSQQWKEEVWPGLRAATSAAAERKATNAGVGKGKYERAVGRRQWGGRGPRRSQQSQWRRKQRDDRRSRLSQRPSPSQRDGRIRSGQSAQRRSRRGDRERARWTRVTLPRGGRVQFCSFGSVLQFWWQLAKVWRRSRASTTRSGGVDP